MQSGGGQCGKADITLIGLDSLFVFHHDLPACLSVRRIMSDKTTYILILEDSVVVSKLLTQRLKGEFPEAEILPAFSLAEARNLVKEIVFDVFILDIQLPDGSGIDFLCEVQTQYPNSRAIILTATRVPEYREIALALGALRFMEKPVKIKELSDIIRDMLGTKEEKIQPEMSFRGTLTSLTPMI